MYIYTVQQQRGIRSLSYETTHAKIGRNSRGGVEAIEGDVNLHRATLCENVEIQQRDIPHCQSFGKSRS